MNRFLVVVFIPPFHFLSQRRWLAFTVDAFFYGLAWLFLLSIIGAAIAPIFWFVAMAYAWFDLATSLRRHAMEQHATLVGRAVAAEIATHGPLTDAPSPAKTRE